MLTDVIVLLLVAMAVIGVIKSGNRRRAVPAEVAAVPAPGVADAAVSITIQLRKLTKPERMECKEEER